MYLSTEKAYDMLLANVIMLEDQEQLALTLNGKKRNIRKKILSCLRRHVEFHRYQRRKC